MYKFFLSLLLFVFLFLFPSSVLAQTPFAWDINNDGLVNIVDIGIVIDNYNKPPIPNINADVNNDGSVDIIDIGILIDNYGATGSTMAPTSTPPISTTPTPTYSPTPVSDVSTPTPAPPSPTSITGKVGDVNADALVNVIDIGIIIDNYGNDPSTSNPKADINIDGSIDIIDIGIVIDNYEK